MNDAASGVTVQSLAGTRKENILRACDQSIEKAKTARVPDLWD